MLHLLGPLVPSALLMVSALLVLPSFLRILWRIAPIVFLTKRRRYRHSGKSRGQDHTQQGVCNGFMSAGWM
jgi:hypothetical protein